MLHLTCTMISSVDLAHYEVSRAEDRVSVDCGTINKKYIFLLYFSMNYRDFSVKSKLIISLF